MRELRKILDFSSGYPLFARNLLKSCDKNPNIEFSTVVFNVKESDPPTLHCAPVVVYERRGPRKLWFHDSASFKNSDRSKITN